MQAHLDNAELKMEERIEKLQHHFQTIRTGRANPNQLAEVAIDYYGTPTPLNQVGSISVVEGRTLVIKPYDSSFLKAIEHAINAHNLGMNPQNDGTVIRISVPPLTEETRRDLTKQVAKFAEEAKIDCRNIRRDVNEQVKKDDTLTEDEEKKAHEKIQKILDEYIKKIDSIVSEKDKEIMTV
jgi:ribosome recycling factor